MASSPSITDARALLIQTIENAQATVNAFRQKSDSEIAAVQRILDDKVAAMRAEAEIEMAAIRDKERSDATAQLVIQRAQVEVAHQFGVKLPVSDLIETCH